MNPTHNVDARMDGECSVCGRKGLTFSIPGSDKGKCTECLVKTAKKSQKPPA